MVVNPSGNTTVSNDEQPLKAYNDGVIYACNRTGAPQTAETVTNGDPVCLMFGRVDEAASCENTRAVYFFEVLLCWIFHMKQKHTKKGIQLFVV